MLHDQAASSFRRRIDLSDTSEFLSVMRNHGSAFGANMTRVILPVRLPTLTTALSSINMHMAIGDFSHNLSGAVVICCDTPEGVGWRR